LLHDEDASVRAATAQYITNEQRNKSKNNKREDE